MSLQEECTRLTKECACLHRLQRNRDAIPGSGGELDYIRTLVKVRRLLAEHDRTSSTYIEPLDRAGQEEEEEARDGDACKGQKD